MTEEERYSFDLQGFLVRRAVLDADALRTVNAEIDAQGYPRPDDTIMGQRFAGFLGAGSAPVATSLMDHPAVLDVVLEANGPNARLDHTYGIYMAPGSSGLWVHGGATPFDPAQYYEVRQGRIHCGLIGVQWALVDHPAGGGGFCCIPGSHKANFVRPQTIEYGNPLLVEVPLSAGDVVFFTEAITHGTLAWTQLYDRRSLFFKYSPGNSSYNVEPPVLPERLSSLTLRQQALCQPPSVAHHRNVPSPAESE